MDWTKPQMWLSILAVVLIFAFTILAVGQDFASSDIVLDERSQDYINEYANNVDQNNLSAFNNNATLQKKKSNPLLDSLNNLPVISDVVGGINFFIDKSKDLISGLSLLYNLPSFFIRGFGIPIGGFSTIINIISYILFLTLLIIAVRIAK